MSAAGAILEIGVGDTIAHDGEILKITELAGRSIVLETHDHRFRRMDLVSLLSHPSTRVSQGEELVPLDSVDEVFDRDGALSGDAAELVGHIREVICGYRRGDEAFALPGEPRAEYHPGLPKMKKYAAKAAELGVHTKTVARWASEYSRAGSAGLCAAVTATTGGRPFRPWGSTDLRWIDAYHVVSQRYLRKSRPGRDQFIDEIELHLEKTFGVDAVPRPSRATAYRLLAKLSKGSNTFTGSTKGKRSIANAPQGVYGALSATRPGEYVLLDTNDLDVYAMEPFTFKWVKCCLTVAIDLFSRCITGLKLTPVSAKGRDVADILYESVRIPTVPGRQEPMPYVGVPSSVVMDASQMVDERGRRLLTPVAAETVVMDHGKIYMSEHVHSVCTELGISIQPARVYQPTDKAVVERFFRTLNDGILKRLPGYKGSDIHSRGEDPTGEAFYFLDELEAIIREWITLIYHQRPHEGATVPGHPGMKLSPNQLYELGIVRTGYLRLPQPPDLALRFLKPIRATIQRYGVEYRGMRYNSPAIHEYANMPSRKGYQWRLRVYDSDARWIYFQEPVAPFTWHAVPWVKLQDQDQPFSFEVAEYARRWARAQPGPFNQRMALRALLERWQAGVFDNPAERRMALRASMESRDVPDGDLLQDEEDTAVEAGAVALLRRPTGPLGPAVLPQTSTPVISHIDEEDDSDDDSFEDLESHDEDADFYAEAFEIG
ncbi:integrase [Streptomyces griseofuscus]|uniref:integrase n=1 Tax=Streptomyces griseofuscus TaxID=146922 RepID=UPI0034571D98